STRPLWGGWDATIFSPPLSVRALGSLDRDLLRGSRFTPPSLRVSASGSVARGLLIGSRFASPPRCDVTAEGVSSGPSALSFRVPLSLALVTASLTCRGPQGPTSRHQLVPLLSILKRRAGSAPLGSWQSLMTRKRAPRKRQREEAASARR